MKCPKCQSEIVLTTINGVPTGTCTGCKGVWFSRSALLYLLENAMAQETENASLDAALRVRQLDDQFQHPSRSSCPSCGRQLKETWVAEIEIEYCASCQGIFLDARELEQIAYRDHSLEQWGRTHRAKTDHVVEGMADILERVCVGDMLDNSVDYLVTKLGKKLFGKT